jgi:hypothetical protein
MHLAMMAAAQRHGEFVAYLAPERTMLCEPKVMRIRRLAPTNQAWLFGDVSNVIAVADATRLGQGQHALVDRAVDSGGGRPPPLFGWPPPQRFWALDRFLCLGQLRCLSVLARQCRKPGFERLLHAFRIGGGETVLGAERPLCPGGGLFR